jgi:broad specificity phosphatase PhoE
MGVSTKDRLKCAGAQQILSAPERRAQMTALSLDLPVSITENLCDCHFGSWRGRESSQVQDDEPPFGSNARKKTDEKFPATSTHGAAQNAEQDENFCLTSTEATFERRPSETRTILEYTVGGYDVTVGHRSNPSAIVLATLRLGM